KGSWVLPKRAREIKQDGGVSAFRTAAGFQNWPNGSTHQLSAETAASDTAAVAAKTARSLKAGRARYRAIGTAPPSQQLQTELTDRVREHPDPFDLHLHGVARLQRDLRVAGVADTRRRAGKDQVARLEREHVRDERDKERHAEDQVRGVSVLQHLAVQPLDDP